jgi:hypothetical protein
MSEKEILVARLKKLKSKQLIDVEFNVYVPANDISMVMPMEIGLQMGGADSGKIALSPDGESIRYLLENVKDADVGPFGKTEMRHEIDGADARHLLGCTIEGVDLVVERGVPIGLELQLSNGSRLLALNAGDQMVVRVNGDHPILHEPGIAREIVL